MKRSITTMAVLVLAVVLAAWVFLIGGGASGPLFGEALIPSVGQEDHRFARPAIAREREPTPLEVSDSADAGLVRAETGHTTTGHAELRLALEALVLRLEEIEIDRPEEYPAQALRACEGLHDLHRHVVAALRVSVLDEVIRGRHTTPGVYATLVAFLAAWGGSSEVLSLQEPSGRGWRTATLGWAWRLPGDFEGARPSEGFELDLDDYRRLVPRLGSSELAVRLSVSPPTAVRSLLAERSRQPALDGEALRDRDVAILTLGLAVDTDPMVQELMRRLLFDPAPQAVQARPPVIFVLSHARSGVCRDLLRAFLDDPHLGRDGRSLALHWLGRRGAYEGLLTDVAATLADPDADDIERTSALSLLNQRFIDGELADDPEAERLLCEYVLQEQDPGLKCAAVMMLAGLDGGQARLSTLATALLEDSNVVCRSAAARGLGRVMPGYVAEARSHLLVARSRESDSRVLKSIESALAVLDG